MINFAPYLYSAGAAWFFIMGLAEFRKNHLKEGWVLGIIACILFGLFWPAVSILVAMKATLEMFQSRN